MFCQAIQIPMTKRKTGSAILIWSMVYLNISVTQQNIAKIWNWKKFNKNPKANSTTAVYLYEKIAVSRIS